MSFFYTNAATSARSRRGKDREGHPRTSSISSSTRRHKDNARSQENKSPVSKSPALPPTIYTQQNIALDQLPSLPSSEATSPTLSLSGVRSSASWANKAGVYHLAQQPYTPAALQQYLEDDTDDVERVERVEKGSHGNSLRQTSTCEGRSRWEQTDMGTKLENATKTFNVERSASRDEQTPLATKQGLQRPEPPLADSKHPRRSSSSAGKKRASRSSNSGELESSGETKGIRRLSKQATSTSDPGVEAEHLYGDAEVFGEHLGYHPAPKALQPNLMDGTTKPAREEAHSGSYITRISPQPTNRSSAVMSRTFTPPAPTFPLASSTTLPDFVSPVPRHAQQPSEQYQVFQQPYNYGVPLHASMMPHQHPGHQNPPFFTKPLVPGYSQLPTGILPPSVPSALEPAPDRDPYGFDHSTQSAPVAGTIDLLRKMYEAIPSIEMMIATAHHRGGASADSRSRQNESEDSGGLYEGKVSTLRQLRYKMNEEKKRHLVETESMRIELENLREKHAESQSQLVQRQKSRERLALESGLLRQQMADITQTLHEQRANQVRDAYSTPDSGKGGTQHQAEEASGLYQRASNEYVAYEYNLGTAKSFTPQEEDSLEKVVQQKRAGLEDSLKKSQNELSELERQQNVARASWEKERRELAYKVENERHMMQNEWLEEKCVIEQHWQEVTQSQIEEYQKALDEAKESQESLLRQERQRCEDLESENERLRDEIKNVTDGWNADKARFSKMAGDFRAATSRLNEQNVSGLL